MTVVGGYVATLVGVTGEGDDIFENVFFIRSLNNWKNLLASWFAVAGGALDTVLEGIVVVVGDGVVAVANVVGNTLSIMSFSWETNVSNSGFEIPLVLVPGIFAEASADSTGIPFLSLIFSKMNLSVSLVSLVPLPACLTASFWSCVAELSIFTGAETALVFPGVAAFCFFRLDLRESAS